MNCVYCPNKVHDGYYVCDECLAATRAQLAQSEAKSRSIKCACCKQPIGAPCITGSGVPRPSSHVVRERRARRKA